MPKKNKDRVALPFRVDPDWLKKKTYVPNGVKIVFTGRLPIKFMQMNILGGSGLEMFFRGFPFTFEQKMAEDLIRKGFAKKFMEKSKSPG